MTLLNPDGCHIEDGDRSATAPHTMHIRKHGTQAPLCGGGGGWGNVSQNQCTGKIYGSLIAVHSEHGRIYSQEGWIKM